MSVISLEIYKAYKDNKKEKLENDKPRTDKSSETRKKYIEQNNELLLKKMKTDITKVWLEI